MKIFKIGIVCSVIILIAVSLVANTLEQQMPSLRIAIPQEAHVRIMYGVSILQESIVANGATVKMVEGEAKPASNTITIGTTKDGEIFGKALGQFKDVQESFALICKPNGSVLIAGADAAGVLYGCLELAERIESLGGRLPKRLTFRDAPKLSLRGPSISMDISGKDYEGTPYDMPYTRENFPWFYDKNMWIVQNHYNIHVSHTFVRHHNLGSRYTFREPTPLIAEYMRYCYSEFIKNYPNVGLMLCFGEALKLELGPEYARDVVIPGVKAGLKPGNPTPPLIFRGHDAPIFKIIEIA